MTIENSKLPPKLQLKLRSNILRLPALLTVSVLSTALLLSGCSDRDNVEADTVTNASNSEDASNSENAVNAAATSENDAADQANGANNTLESEQRADSAKRETSIDNDTRNPVTSSVAKNSLVTNPTEPGTPEDTVKQALNTLYFGDAKDAVRYYDVDMVDFADELAKTQSAFQQTVEAVTLLGTQYNEDKTLATINGEIRLKGQSKPAPLAYQLKKVKGQWKILG